MKRTFAVCSIILLFSFAALSVGEDGYVIGTRNNTAYQNQNQQQQHNFGSTTQDRKIFFNDTYFFGQNGFFDVGDNLRLTTLENKMYAYEEENRDLKEEIRTLKLQIQSFQNALNSLSTGNPGGVLDNGTGGGGLIDPPTFPDPIDPVQPVPDPELAAKVEKLFVASCGKCHTQGRESGEFALISVNKTLLELDADQVRAVHKRTVLTPEELAKEGLTIMPKGGQRLGLAERNLITAWANAKLGL